MLLLEEGCVYVGEGGGAGFALNPKLLVQCRVTVVRLSDGNVCVFVMCLLHHICEKTLCVCVCLCVSVYVFVDLCVSVCVRVCVYCI